MKTGKVRSSGCRHHVAPEATVNDAASCLVVNVAAEVADATSNAVAGVIPADAIAADVRSMV